MTENAELKQTIASLRENIINIKQQNELANKQSSNLPSISEEEIAILQFLSGVEDASFLQITNGIKHNTTKTKYWVNRLSEFEMIYTSHGYNNVTSHGLKQSGREYLVENDLV